MYLLFSLYIASYTVVTLSNNKKFVYYFAIYFMYDYILKGPRVIIPLTRCDYLTNRPSQIG